MKLEMGRQAERRKIDRWSERHRESEKRQGMSQRVKKKQIGV